MVLLFPCRPPRPRPPHLHLRRRRPHCPPPWNVRPFLIPYYYPHRWPGHPPHPIPPKRDIAEMYVCIHTGMFTKSVYNEGERENEIDESRRTRRIERERVERERTTA